MGNADDEDGNTVPMSYKSGDPVYRTINALATSKLSLLFWELFNQKQSFIGLQGERPGSYLVHEPPVFSDVLVVECRLLQAGVTIRTEVDIFIQRQY